MLYTLVCFIANDTKFLYNDKQRVLPSCYTDDVTMEFNKNTN